MRIKAILSFIIIGALISVFSIFFLDNMIKNKIIKNGQEATGAKVEIASSNMSFRPFGIELKGIQVANKENPMENSLEFDTLAMHINIKGLIRKKLIVENLIATGLKTQTKRKRSGALEKSSKRKEKKEPDKNKKRKKEIKSSKLETFKSK